MRRPAHEIDAEVAEILTALGAQGTDAVKEPLPSIAAAQVAGLRGHPYVPTLETAAFFAQARTWAEGFDVDPPSAVWTDGTIVRIGSQHLFTAFMLGMLAASLLLTLPRLLP